ncbi:hypothetical protein C8Q77DRAFT_1099855 [Trametes polyzona]|nr:hypothetical protein C8Q77DRAFT_1099855 [Trametes polyzona]
MTQDRNPSVAVLNTNPDIPMSTFLVPLPNEEDELAMAAFCAGLNTIFRQALTRGNLPKATLAVSSQLASRPDLHQLAIKILGRLYTQALEAPQSLQAPHEPFLRCTICRTWFLDSRNSKTECCVPHAAPPQMIMVAGEKAAYPAQWYPCCGTSFIMLPGVVFRPLPYCYRGPHVSAPHNPSNWKPSIPQPQ